jgi:hypothetical protein
MSDRVTYASLHDLLTRLGFTWEAQGIQRAIQPREPKTCVVYRHANSGATLWLPTKGDRPALAADVMSVRAHLVHRGLLEEDEFARFVKENALADQAT